MQSKRLAILLAFLALAAGPAQPDITLAPSDTIEGTWNLTWFNGRVCTHNETWKIDQSRFDMHLNGRSVLVWTYHMDTSRQPTAIDCTGGKAICSVEGSKLMICVGTQAARPKDFKVGGGSLYVFMRAP